MIKPYLGKKYFVIFTKSKYTNWYSKLLDKCFGHVCIARKSDGEKFWIVTDALGGNLLTDTFPMCDIRKLYPDAVVVKRWSTIYERPTFRIFHLNCVEMVKLVLGIRKWYIITPYQLYKHIKEKNHV